MSLLLIRSRNRCLKIPDIVQAVKDTYDINSIGGGFLHKIFHYIVGIGAISENILSAEEHLKLCMLESVAELSQPLPRILFKETQRCIKCCAAPAFDRVVPYFVHLINNRKHLFCCHSCGDQRLVCITKNRLCNLNRFFFYFCHLFFLHNNYLTPKIAINVPATTAVPITPATFGPIACIRRKLVGSASAPTF